LLKGYKLPSILCQGLLRVKKQFRESSESLAIAVIYYILFLFY